MKRELQQGFTLIELAIVLVIIGLMVGGVLAGQDLINAARLRKTGTELTQLSTAVRTFQIKYDCLPGDCKNATTFFGQSPDCPNAYYSPLVGTCDGNGDGVMNAFHSDGNVEATWGMQQLGLAKFVPWANSYGGGWTTLTPGVTIPPSSYNSAIGYYIHTPSSALISFYQSGAMPGKTIIQIGALRSDGSSTDYLWGSGFTAPQAFALDSKIDDGKASGGLLMGTDAPTGGGGTGQSSVNQNVTCLTGTQYSTSVATGCILYFTLN